MTQTRARLLLPQRPPFRRREPETMLQRYVVEEPRKRRLHSGSRNKAGRELACR